MGYWRFRRSFPVGPFRLNLGKKSVSITAGRRRGGPHVTASSTGHVTTSVGLPGTGLSYVDRRRVRRHAARATGWLRRHAYWLAVGLVVLAWSIWHLV